tara:strand:+ start:269 stop:646 length:378 start_codon:yes stop_codon:yes gene_type:complete
MFGKRNVVRPSPRGGKGGRPIQAPMRGRRRGAIKPSRQAKLFDPARGVSRALGGRGRAVRGGPVRASSKARLFNPARGVSRALGGRGRGPVRGRGRGTGMLATGRGRAVRGGPVRAARRPQYKRR